MRLRKLGVVAAALATVGSALLYGAGPASADIIGTKRVSDNCVIDGCSQGDLYIYYHSVANSGEGNPSGSFAQFYGNVYDQGSEDVPARGTNVFWRYLFVYYSGYGDGSGQGVKNNAAAADNCSSTDGYRIYYNSGFTGHSQSIPHYFGCGSSTNLDSTLKNNNASSHFA
ncbi:hypothetical protein AB5J72_35920 [Streptomyces sp. CG1]|uniref:hypothetical protein n=1 Tax=Streptomyces sp. CG1 TaxID=1287523 RepID=UPI0034E21FA1